MSRSISQIYSEAVATRNDYLQMSNLNSGRSGSKLSVINILTYIMAALIYSYETLFDVFQIQVAQLIAGRVSGTAAFYVKMAEYFQYNPDTEAMDEMTYDDTTFQAKFVNLDESHRIIAKAGYEKNTDTSIILKVCKNNNNTYVEGGGIYRELEDNELTAFKNYIDEVKFIGAKISCISIPGDYMSINATVYYDDLYINADQAMTNVKKSLINYIKNVGFNTYVYYQAVIDAIRSAEHITDVQGVSPNSYAVVKLTKWNQTERKYKSTDAVELTGSTIPLSGYLTFVDADGNSSLVANTTHFVFKKNSEKTVS